MFKMLENTHLHPFFSRRLCNFSLCFFVLYLIIGNVLSATITWDEPPPIGNFALPKSQRPGAFYSGGSKILDPGQIQYNIKPGFAKYTKSYFITSPSQVLFGTSKHTSLFVALPFSLDTMHQFPNGERSHVTGPGNMSVQGEYEFLHRTTSTSIQESGLLLGISAPTSSLRVSPHWSSYFFGATYTHTWTDWLIFAEGALDTFEGPKDIRPGEQFYFNTGIGRNLNPEADDHNLLAFMQFSSSVAQSSPLQRIFAHSSHPLGAVLSDGYILFATPSLWYSNKNWIFQLVYTQPITQHWAFTASKLDYFSIFSVTYTIR